MSRPEVEELRDVLNAWLAGPKFTRAGLDDLIFILTHDEDAREKLAEIVARERRDLAAFLAS